MSYAIQTQNLTKIFRQKLSFRRKQPVKALDNVNITVNTGEVFGLLGKNGAGKTTLIRILCGLVRPTSGKAEVLGKDAINDSLSVRKRIGLLPQESSCYELLTAKENILYYGGIHGVDEETLHSRTDELLDLIDLRGRANDLTKEFSGGMKRKVLVARALVTDPDLVFLDEPTTGIDILGARVIRTLIKRLSKELRKTVFLTTHDLAEVEQLCNRVGIMVDGKLVAVGEPAHLENQFKASGLEELFLGLSTGEIDFE
ncbi:MAG TPA: ABC transporter ATP-binding protein [Candidatus Hodarchaeales archaeon]|nr:ABC transporter ATP-binding protein [Candidatus Hodarchaeales archaeon]